MGFLRNEVSRQFIAAPDDRKDQIVYKWPDLNLRKGARAIVNADQVALFVSKGQVIGTVGPGQHRLDADELMFLGIVIDWATDGNAYRAELYFVGTREYVGQTFGGPVDGIKDPDSGIYLKLRVYGEFAMRVVDPARLILNLVGTVDVSDNSAITDWMSEQLLMVIRTELTRRILKRELPILGISAFTPEIERATIEAANYRLADYGLAISRMGNFNVNLDEETEEVFAGLAADTAYSRLAGSYQQYASGRALIGAGEGMSKGGEGVGPAFLGMGLGMGGQMAQPYPVGPTPPPYAGGTTGAGAQAPQAGAAVTCSNCGTVNAPGAKFCQNCGTALPQANTFCSNCGAQVDPSARFCPSCGTPRATPAAGAAAEPAPAPAPAPPQGSPPAPPPPEPPPPPAPPAAGSDPAAPPPPPPPRA